MVLFTIREMVYYIKIETLWPLKKEDTYVQSNVRAACNFNFALKLRKANLEFQSRFLKKATHLSLLQ